MTLSGSVIEQSHQVGVAVFGAKATIVIVRDTQPDGAGAGYALLVRASTAAPRFGHRTHVLVQNSSAVGVSVSDSISTSRTARSHDRRRCRQPWRRDRRPARLGGDPDLVRSRVALARAGVVLPPRRRLDLECNPIALDGEDVTAGPFHFEDLGGNECTCNGGAAPSSAPA
jgi:hypothetical protein